MGDEAAREVGLFAADEGVVQMQLHRPLPDLGNFGVVDLDLVDGMRRDRGCEKQRRGKEYAS
jgi:hypothetical protein